MAKKNTVRIVMEDSAKTYEFGWWEAAEDFADRATHIKGVVQVSLNGDNLLPESFVIPVGAHDAGPAEAPLPYNPVRNGPLAAWVQDGAE